MIVVCVVNVFSLRMDSDAARQAAERAKIAIAYTRLDERYEQGEITLEQYVDEHDKIDALLKSTWNWAKLGAFNIV